MRDEALKSATRHTKPVRARSLALSKPATELEIKPPRSPVRKEKQ